MPNPSENGHHGLTREEAARALIEGYGDWMKNGSPGAPVIRFPKKGTKNPWGEDIRLISVFPVQSPQK